MSKGIKITYVFSFEKGNEVTFDVKLERDGLKLISDERDDAPPWTELDKNKCENCTLDSSSDKHCPVALNYAKISNTFRDQISFEKVDVWVETEDRTYSKHTTLQTGLGSLMGIVMVSSGCPVMEFLKPMVRFHLPFATVEETIFRMVSMYLVAQHLIQDQGGEADWDLVGLDEIYNEVCKVNRDFVKRLQEGAKKDANINALLTLDSFAMLVPMERSQVLDEIKTSFSAYLK